MRLIWKVAVFLLIVVLAQKAFSSNAPKDFIDFHSKTPWKEQLQTQLGVWQEQIQDLPASIEVQIKQLWQDVQPGGNGKAV